MKRISVPNGKKRKLALHLSAVLAMTAPLAGQAGDTWIVTSCSDDVSGDLAAKTGTLRFAAANAASADAIDLGQLPGTYGCSTISLRTGAVTLAQHDLVLKGSAAARVTLTGEYLANGKTYSSNDRIITHTGFGSLSLYDLTIEAGNLRNIYQTAVGGCLYSKGSVLLERTDVRSCHADSPGSSSLGAGIAVLGNATLDHAALTGNVATSGPLGNAFGGAAIVDGDFNASYSTISANKVYGPPGYDQGNAGGLFLRGNVSIVSSTISANFAGNSHGGMEIYAASPGGLSTRIINSTISGNTATRFTGGLYINTPTIAIRNSTIAFNTAGQGSNYGLTLAPGIVVSALYGFVDFSLTSSILSNNTYGSVEDDLSTIYEAFGAAVIFNAAPARNIVRVSKTPSILPADTMTGCPLLGPLRDNGGPVPTHALESGSPAIDAGDAPARLFYDERGIGYPRKSGASVDIGAYEVQQADTIFAAGNEGCF